MSTVMTFNNFNEGISFLNNRGEAVISKYMIIAKSDVVGFIESQKNLRLKFLASLALKKLSKKTNFHIARVFYNKNTDCTDVSLNDLIHEFNKISKFTSYSEFKELGYKIDLISDRSKFEPKYHELFWLYFAIDNPIKDLNINSEYIGSLQNYHPALIEILAEDNLIDDFCALARRFKASDFDERYINDISEILALNILKYNTKYLSRGSLDLNIKAKLLKEYHSQRNLASHAAIVANKLNRSKRELSKMFDADSSQKNRRHSQGTFRA